MINRIALAVSALLLAATPAFAHLAPGEHGSFLSGFSHPLFGLDHVVAMLAVGVWAATLGGRALLSAPTAFVGAMMIGFALALAGLALPMAEPMILSSVVMLGLMVAAAVRLPAAAAAGLVGIFALFHGFAHGGELGAAAALPFAAGFVIATALLHAAGAAMGMRVNLMVARVLGTGAAMAGAALAFG